MKNESYNTQNNKENVDIPILTKQQIPDALEDAYNQGKLVVFIGAGISRLAGCEGWDDMSNKLIKNICPPKTSSQIINSSLSAREKITIAKRYAEDNKKMAVFWKTFKDAIKPPKLNNEVYKTISQLKTTFVTTNCDKLLVNCFPKLFTTNCNTNTLAEHIGKTYVFCIHGNYGESAEERDTLVFSIEDYLRTYQIESDTVKFLKKLMNENTVLFLGYGLKEFEIITSAFDSKKSLDSKLETNKHFILEGFYTYQQEYANALSKYYASMNIELIAYSKDEKEYEQQLPIIKDWISDLTKYTDYNSRTIDEITSSNRLGRQEKILISNALLTEDDTRYAYAKAYFNTLTQNPSSGKFIVYLLESVYKNNVLFTGFPESKQDIDRCRYFFQTICICMSKYGFSDHQRVAAYNFVKETINNHLDIILQTKDNQLLNAIIKTFILSGAEPVTEKELLLIDMLRRFYDGGCSTIIECAAEIKIWSKTSQENILMQPFYLNDSGFSSYILYTNEDYCSFVAANFSDDIKRNIVLKCFDLFYDVEKDSFFVSFDERFHYETEKYSYYLSKCIALLIKSLCDKTKEEIVTELFNKMDGVFKRQSAFHYADISDTFTICGIKPNPLNGGNVFVDFYCWIYKAINKQAFSVDECNIIGSWVIDADFGFDDFYDDKTYEIRKKKTRNTYKIQLLELLSTVTKKFEDVLKEYKNEGFFNRKTPVEDKEEYYSLKNDIFIVDVPVDSKKSNNAKQLIAQVKDAVNRANFGSDFWDYQSAYLNLFNQKECTTENIQDVFNELLNNDFENIAPALSYLINYEHFSRFDKSYLKKLLRKIILRINKKIQNIKKSILGTIINQVISILDNMYTENYCQESEILDLLMHINVKNVFKESDDSYNESDTILRLINVTESRTYTLAIKCAFSCKNKKAQIDKFWNWILPEDSKSASIYFIESSAFNYYMLLSIDAQKALEIIWPIFNSYNNVGSLGICFCAQSLNMKKEVLEYLFTEKNIAKLCKEMDDKSPNKRNSELCIQNITYAYSLKYIDLNQYCAFVRKLPDNDAVASHLAFSIIKGIIYPNEAEQDSIIKEIYTIFCSTHKADIFYKKIVENIGWLETISETMWDIIKDATKHGYYLDWFWNDIGMCILKSKDKNSKIIEAVDLLCSLCEKDQKAVQYEYDIDKVLKALAQKGLNGSIRRVANYAIKKCIEPMEKYLKYVEKPETAIELLKKTF